MRIISEVASFDEEVGTMNNWCVLKKLGIESQFLDCAYSRGELDELIDFCLANPKFHIVSRVGMRFIANRIHPEACHYYLANGNCNPELVCYDRDLNYIFDPHLLEGKS